MKLSCIIFILSVLTEKHTIAQLPKITIPQLPKITIPPILPRITVPILNDTLNPDLNGGITLTNPNDKVTFGTAACEKCTKYVADNFISFTPFLKSLNNKKSAGFGPCLYCLARGYETFHPYGDACVTNVTNIYETKYPARFDNHVTECVCNFTANMPDLINELTSTKIPSNCGEDTGKVTQTVVQGLTAVGNIIDPSTLSSCIGLNNPSLQVTVTLRVYTVNYTLLGRITEDVTIRGPKSTKLKEIKEIERNFENINITCDSGAISEICTCLIDTQFVKIFEDAAANYVANCILRNDSNIELRSTFNSYASCAKLPA